MRTIPPLSLSLLAGSLWLGNIALPAQGLPASAQAKRHKPDPSAEFFADRRVRIFDIDESGLARLDDWRNELDQGKPLVCELNALSGEAWFDLASLHLRRLDHPGN
jgi:hypothetical protein